MTVLYMQIMANPTLPHPPIFMTDDCTICMSDFVNPKTEFDEIYVAGTIPVGEGDVSSCGHVFHGRCLSKWFETESDGSEDRGASCPLCKKGANVAFSINGRRECDKKFLGHMKYWRNENESFDVGTIVYGLVQRYGAALKFVKVYAEDFANPFNNEGKLQLA